MPDIKEFFSQRVPTSKEVSRILCTKNTYVHRTVIDYMSYSQFGQSRIYEYLLLVQYPTGDYTHFSLPRTISLDNAPNCKYSYYVFLFSWSWGFF